MIIILGLQIMTVDVVISYSNVDRGRAMALLRVLRALQVRAWIDRPPDTPATDRDAGITGGASYAEEIVRAIQSCSAVISLCSANYWLSRNTLAEIELASRYGKRIVPLHLSEVNPPPSFQYFLSSAQAVPLYAREEAVWAADVSRALRAIGIQCLAQLPAGTESETPPLPRKRVWSFRRKSLLPFLVDRRAQNDGIDLRLTQHYEGRGTRPLVFFVYGLTEQRVDMYQQRVVEYEIRSLLDRLGLPDEFVPIYVEWPRATEAQNQLLRLRQGVLEKLGLRSTANDEEMSRALLNLRRPVAIHTMSGLDLWSDRDRTALADWVSAWSRFPSLPPSQPLIILFFARYTRDDRPILGLVNTLRRAHGVNKLASRLRQMSVEVITELANVHLDQVTEWVTEVVEPDDPNAMLKDVEEFFGQEPRQLTEGLAMAPLAPKLGVLIDRHVRA
jgi:hypothetical protein